MQSPPKPNPYYEDHAPEELILRDHLALDRTELANERTLLAYIRTALALFLTGFSAMHLPSFDLDLELAALVYQIFGWVLVVAAAAVLIVGWMRFKRVQKRIAELYGD